MTDDHRLYTSGGYAYAWQCPKCDDVFQGDGDAAMREETCPEGQCPLRAQMQEWRQRQQ